MSLPRRSNTVIVGPATAPTLGASYTVAIGEQGATAAAASSGTTITVDAPHGFAAGDKIYNFTSGTFIAAAISSVTSTTIVYAAATPTISLGDQLFNLGADTSAGSTPNYDALPTIYSDIDGGTAATNPLTCDSLGNYEYHYTGSGYWEMIRDTSGTPQAVIARYNATLAGTSLPATASRGDVFTVLGGSGVADTTYVWQKGSDDVEDWTPIVGA